MPDPQDLQAPWWRLFLLELTMTANDYEQVIDDLETLIAETRATLVRFKETGMDEQMSSDYQRLHELYAKAVNDQRAYTLAMLDLPAEGPMTGEGK